MKNKVIKAILLVIVVAIFYSYPVLANDPSANPGYWEPTLETNSSSRFETAIEAMLGYINAIGIVVSVIIVVIVGLRYMLGSVEEKAEYKKTMIGFIVGAILLFSVTTIPNVLYNIGTSIGNETASPRPVLPPERPIDRIPLLE